MSPRLLIQLAVQILVQETEPIELHLHLDTTGGFGTKVLKGVFCAL